MNNKRAWAIAYEHAPLFDSDDQQDEYEVYIDTFIGNTPEGEITEDLLINYCCEFES